MGEIKINEHILKLTGKVSLPKPLQLSKTYVVEIEGDVTESTDKDRQDGTFDREFKFEPLTVDVKNLVGDSMRGKTQTKSSAKIRARQWIWKGEHNSDMEYEQFAFLLNTHFDEVMEVLIKHK